jgi:hypothetical protein
VWYTIITQRAVTYKGRYGMFTVRLSESKVFAADAMKAYRGNGGITPLILISALEMEATGYLHAQGALTWYPLSTKLGGPQSRYGGFVEKQNSFPLRGLEPRSVISITTTQLRLLVLG